MKKGVLEVAVLAALFGALIFTTFAYAGDKQEVETFVFVPLIGGVSGQEVRSLVLPDQKPTSGVLIVNRKIGGVRNPRVSPDYYLDRTSIATSLFNILDRTLKTKANTKLEVITNGPRELLKLARSTVLNNVPVVAITPQELAKLRGKGRAIFISDPETILNFEELITKLVKRGFKVDYFSPLAVVEHPDRFTNFLHSGTVRHQEATEFLEELRRINSEYVDPGSHAYFSVDAETILKQFPQLSLRDLRQVRRKLLTGWPPSEIIRDLYSKEEVRNLGAAEKSRIEESVSELIRGVQLHELEIPKIPRSPLRTSAPVPPSAKGELDRTSKEELPWVLIPTIGGVITPRENGTSWQLTNLISRLWELRANSNAGGVVLIPNGGEKDLLRVASMLPREFQFDLTSADSSPKSPSVWAGSLRAKQFIVIASPGVLSSIHPFLVELSLRFPDAKFQLIPLTSALASPDNIKEVMSGSGWTDANGLVSQILISRYGSFVSLKLIDEIRLKHGQGLSPKKIYAKVHQQFELEDEKNKLESLIDDVCELPPIRSKTVLTMKAADLRYPDWTFPARSKALRQAKEGITRANELRGSRTTRPPRKIKRLKAGTAVYEKILASNKADMVIEPDPANPGHFKVYWPETVHVESYYKESVRAELFELLYEAGRWDLVDPKHPDHRLFFSGTDSIVSDVYLGLVEQDRRANLKPIQLVRGDRLQLRIREQLLAPRPEWVVVSKILLRTSPSEISSGENPFVILSRLQQASAIEQVERRRALTSSEKTKSSFSNRSALDKGTILFVLDTDLVMKAERGKRWTPTKVGQNLIPVVVTPADVGAQAELGFFAVETGRDAIVVDLDETLELERYFKWLISTNRSQRFVSSPNSRKEADSTRILSPIELRKLIDTFHEQGLGKPFVEYLEKKCLMKLLMPDVEPKYLSRQQTDVVKLQKQHYIYSRALARDTGTENNRIKIAWPSNSDVRSYIPEMTWKSGAPESIQHIAFQRVLAIYGDREALLRVAKNYFKAKVGEISTSEENINDLEELKHFTDIVGGLGNVADRILGRALKLRDPESLRCLFESVPIFSAFLKRGAPVDKPVKESIRRLLQAAERMQESNGEKPHPILPDPEALALVNEYRGKARVLAKDLRRTNTRTSKIPVTDAERTGLSAPSSPKAKVIKLDTFRDKARTVPPAPIGGPRAMVTTDVVETTSPHSFGSLALEMYPATEPSKTEAEPTEDNLILDMAPSARNKSPHRSSRPLEINSMKGPSEPSDKRAPPFLLVVGQGTPANLDFMETLEKLARARNIRIAVADENALRYTSDHLDYLPVENPSDINQILNVLYRYGGTRPRIQGTIAGKKSCAKITSSINQSFGLPYTTQKALEPWTNVLRDLDPPHNPFGRTFPWDEKVPGRDFTYQEAIETWYRHTYDSMSGNFSKDVLSQEIGEAYPWLGYKRISSMLARAIQSGRIRKNEEHADFDLEIVDRRNPERRIQRRDLMIELVKDPKYPSVRDMTYLLGLSSMTIGTEKERYEKMNGLIPTAKDREVADRWNTYYAEKIAKNEKPIRLEFQRIESKRSGVKVGTVDYWLVRCNSMDLLDGIRDDFDWTAIDAKAQRTYFDLLVDLWGRVGKDNNPNIEKQKGSVRSRVIRLAKRVWKVEPNQVQGALTRLSNKGRLTFPSDIDWKIARPKVREYLNTTDPKSLNDLLVVLHERWDSREALRVLHPGFSDYAFAVIELLKIDLKGAVVTTKKVRSAWGEVQKENDEIPRRHLTDWAPQRPALVEAVDTEKRNPPGGRPNWRRLSRDLARKWSSSDNPLTDEEEERLASKIEGQIGLIVRNAAERPNDSQQEPPQLQRGMAITDAETSGEGLRSAGQIHNVLKLTLLEKQNGEMVRREIVKMPLNIVDADQAAMWLGGKIRDHSEKTIGTLRDYVETRWRVLSTIVGAASEPTWKWIHEYHRQGFARSPIAVEVDRMQARPESQEIRALSKYGRTDLFGSIDIVDWLLRFQNGTIRMSNTGTKVSKKHALSEDSTSVEEEVDLTDEQIHQVKERAADKILENPWRSIHKIADELAREMLLNENFRSQVEQIVVDTRASLKKASLVETADPSSSSRSSHPSRTRSTSRTIVTRSREDLTSDKPRKRTDRGPRDLVQEPSGSGFRPYMHGPEAVEPDALGSLELAEELPVAAPLADQNGGAKKRDAGRAKAPKQSSGPSLAKWKETHPLDSKVVQTRLSRQGQGEGVAVGRYSSLRPRSSSSSVAAPEIEPPGLIDSRPEGEPIPVGPILPEPPSTRSDPRQSLDSARSSSPEFARPPSILGGFGSGFVNYGGPKVASIALRKGVLAFLDEKERADLAYLADFRNPKDLVARSQRLVKETGLEYVELHVFGSLVDSSLTSAHAALREVVPSIAPLGAEGIQASPLGSALALALVLGSIDVAHGNLHPSPLGATYGTAKIMGTQLGVESVFRFLRLPASMQRAALAGELSWSEFEPLMWKAPLPPLARFAAMTAVFALLDSVPQIYNYLTVTLPQEKELLHRFVQAWQHLQEVSFTPYVRPEYQGRKGLEIALAQQEFSQAAWMYWSRKPNQIEGQRLAELAALKERKLSFEEREAYAIDLERRTTEALEDYWTKEARIEKPLSSSLRIPTIASISGNRFESCAPQACNELFKTWIQAQPITTRQIFPKIGLMIQATQAAMHDFWADHDVSLDLPIRLLPTPPIQRAASR